MSNVCSKRKDQDDWIQFVKRVVLYLADPCFVIKSHFHVPVSEDYHATNLPIS